jgi:hypothetical protein
MKKSSLVVAVVTGWLLVGAVVAAPQGAAANWMPMQLGVTPGPTAGHAMVYDSSAQSILMFGGDIGNNAGGLLSAQTWEFKNLQWAQLSVSSAPSARSEHGMAYDPVRQRVVLYGGQDGSANLADTWEWGGSSWHLITTNNSPGPLRSHAMCFHAGIGKVVLFGGVGGSPHWSSQTWVFDGVDWAAVVTAQQPSGREWHGMAYDMARGVAVVYGGSTGGTQPTDTWEFDGAVWQQVVTPTVPGSRINHEMQYDLLGGRLLLHAGENSSETWEYDGAQWMQIVTQTTPPARGYFASAFDTSRGALVVHGGWNGGSTIFDEPWEFFDRNAVPWPSSAMPYGLGCGSPTLTLTPVGSPMIGSVGTAVVSSVPVQLGGVSMGFSDTLLTGLPILPLSLASLGMPGCELLHSNDVFGLPVTAGAPGTLDFSYAIPGDANLLGAHVYLQAYCYAPGANALEIIASNGIDWLIGNQ